MKTKFKFYITATLSLLIASCVDHVPEIEDLPSPDVAFNYSVVDENYQLDYYVGARIEFRSTGVAQGAVSWDFGDGSPVMTGNIVEYKYHEAGTYQVKLTIGDKSTTQSIFISDIKPIMTLNILEDDICEVLSTYVNFDIELPNPEGLEEEYLWTFPEGTIDENGNPAETSTDMIPGKIKFSNVGSQSVRLQVKLGGRVLEESVKNVQVGYNEEVPTLYYAEKGGNIKALKLVNNSPSGMKIKPYDMGVKSGQHPLNILFNDTSLYILDCGRQFTYVAEPAGLGDGRITVMSKDGARVETMMVNTGDAFDDPFYGYIENGQLYFADRRTGITRIGLSERNKSFSRSEYPYYVENAQLGYYGAGIPFGAINACIGKVGDTWYMCKTYGGDGIFRFLDSDILSVASTDAATAAPIPASGQVLASITPKSFVYDAANNRFYFTSLRIGAGGLYSCTLEQLDGIGTANLIGYQLTTANNKGVVPVIEAGKGEGAPGEFIGICQLALNEADGCVYFGFRSGEEGMKSGLMRYNPATGNIEYVIEDVDVYGVVVNNAKSKLF